MSPRNLDEKVWRFLGGQPPSREFSELISSDPEAARRLAELAMIECAIREEALGAGSSSNWARGRLFLMWGGGALLVSAMAVFVGWALTLSQPVAGTPMVMQGGEKVEGLASEVRSGKTIRDSEKGFSLVFAGEETRLEVEANAEIRFEETSAGGKLVLLDSGSIGATVSPQKEPLRVVTPHLALEVLGTAFDVGVSDRSSEVLVDRGMVAVEVAPVSEPIPLTAGSGWKQDENGRGSSVATARYVSSSPVIDQGNDSIWDSQAVKVNRFEGDRMEAAPLSNRDHSSQWRAIWNEKALYVLIEVVDSDADSSNERVWANDSVEVFIDADNSRGTGFDGVNDHFLFFEPGSESITPGVGALSPDPGISHEAHRTVDGFRVEVCLPWAGLGIRPRGGLRLGFNVASNDSDPGDAARSQLSWTPKTGSDWSRPDRMGSLILSSPEPGERGVTN
ncbi:MAG: sugar-binding protein [Verrucomicrobiales bacterium]|nr:sugar-binding protein [Verrucomicrobiales bacterium]